RHRSSFYIQQFHFKDQCRAAGNDWRPALVAISDIRRTNQFSLAAYFHLGNAFCPAWDDLPQWKFHGLTALHGTVENLAVNEAARVVNFDDVRCFGFSTGASFDLLVNKAGRQLLGAAFLGGIL